MHGPDLRELAAQLQNVGHETQAARRHERRARLAHDLRERTSLAQKLRAAKERRDQVVGSTARDRVEAEILRLSERDEALEQRIQALDSREDEVYRKWRNAYHDLRYRTPQVTRLFTVTFRIAQARETSC